MQCEVSNTQYEMKDTSRAEYDTRLNGTVIVSSDGESPPAVTCGLSADRRP